VTSIGQGRHILTIMLRSEKKPNLIRLWWPRCAMLFTFTYLWSSWRETGCEGVRKPTKAGARMLSYSLYGNEARYTQGAIANARMFKHVYPGWGMRVYYDSSVPETILETLKTHGVQLVNFTGSKLNKMTWRFLPISERNIERFCSRDIDSRLSLRERVAVDEWISSGRKFHVLRDHPSHSNFAMSGGMWCAKSRVIPNLELLLEQATLNDDYLKDMDFLNEKIWPLARKDVLQHDAFSCAKFGARPFPTPRIGLEHIGSVYIDGEMREADVDILRASLKNVSHRPTQCET